MATLNSKEIKERSKAKGDDGEGLYMRRRTDHRDSHQSRGKSRSKSRGRRLKCYICQSKDHLRRNYPKNNRKKSTGYVKKDEQPSSSGSTYDDSEVMMVMSAQALLDWIMDSGWSVRSEVLTRNLISLGTLEKEGFTVKLQLGKGKVINGSRVVLSGIQRDNCIYSLDGHAMAGELNASVKEKDSLAQEGMGLYPQVQTRSIWKVQRVEAFEQLCVKSGIARHLIVAGTPKQNRSPSTAIEKTTPMEMWSGHPSDYGMLRIFSCITYSHVKQGKLEPRAVKRVLLGYPEGVKGYKLYRLDDESPKIVTSKNVVFNESFIYKDTLKDSGAGADKSVEELQVVVELQRLNNHTPEEDKTYQEDGDDEDVRDKETDQTPDLTDYQLARDKEPRTITKPLSFKWKAVMKEEMDFLRKNKTWEFVDHPAGQKLVSCKWLFKIKEGIEGVQKPRNFKEVIYMRQPPGCEQEQVKIGGLPSLLLKKGVRHEGAREAKKNLDNGKLVKCQCGHIMLSLKIARLRIARQSIMAGSMLADIMQRGLCNGTDHATMLTMKLFAKVTLGRVWAVTLTLLVAVNWDNQAQFTYRRNQFIMKGQSPSCAVITYQEDLRKQRR
ncbi:retrotransposon protein, putative, ty1-copia subclass [Tanacetum coccineum]